MNTKLLAGAFIAATLIMSVLGPTSAFSQNHSYDLGVAGVTVELQDAEVAIMYDPNNPDSKIIKFEAHVTNNAEVPIALESLKLPKIKGCEPEHQGKPCKLPFSNSEIPPGETVYEALWWDGVHPTTVPGQGSGKTPAIIEYKIEIGTGNDMNHHVLSELKFIAFEDET